MTDQPYHHGNLRNALLERAVELARAGGPEAVVVRDVQRALGVSHSAAYRHYAGRPELLAAVRRYALGQLGDAMRASMNAVTARPLRKRAVARLRATGQAYLAFALDEPGLFRTAFGFDPASPADDHDYAGRHPFQILTGCVDELVAAKVLAADQRDGLDEATWSAVHGLATLLLDGPLHTAEPARRQVIIDRLLDVISRGITGIGDTQGPSTR